MTGRFFLLLSVVLFLAACGRKREIDLSSAPIDSIQHGVRLMATHCDTCHRVDELGIDEMLAPPLWGVRAHYLKKYPEPEDFVGAMTGFIVEPKEGNGLLPMEVEHYGLKAPVSLTETEIRSVVWAIYAGQVERPPWSRKYRERHRDCEADW